MRAVACSTVLLCAGALHASANTERIVSDLMARYGEHCGFAFTNPQGYIESVPNPGPVGNTTVAVSPDGNVVKVYQVVDGAAIEVNFAIHAKQLSVACLAMSDGEALYEQTSLFDYTSPEAMLRFGRELAAAVERFFASRDELAPVGGQTPVDYVAVWVQQEALREIDRANFTYGFVLTTEGVETPSMLSVQNAGVTIFGWRNIEIAQ